MYLSTRSTASKPLPGITWQPSSVREFFGHTFPDAWLFTCHSHRVHPISLFPHDRVFDAFRRKLAASATKFTARAFGRARRLVPPQPANPPARNSRTIERLLHRSASIDTRGSTSRRYRALAIRDLYSTPS